MIKRHRAKLLVAVVGLGRFGLTAAETLVKQGYEVLGIDHAEEAVRRAKDVVTHVVQAELHDQGLVRELGLHEVDAAIVGIEHVEASIVNTMLLLEAGVPYVVVRAHTSLHGRILERLGAHRVIYPEAHSGEAAARSLHAPDVIEHIELGPGLSINKLRAPSAWVGRRPDDLRRGDQGSFIVLVIQRGEETIVMPNADACIKEGDILALLARESALSKLPRDLQRRR